MVFKGREVLLYLSLIYEGCWDKIYQAVNDKMSLDPEEVTQTIAQIDCGYVTILDEDYPEVFKQVYKPPFVLYYRGDLSLWKRRMMTVVGSREESEYGRTITREIVAGLVNDFVIVSGMARGIDTHAHQSAIAHGGKTIAVLGSGIDRCYPDSNKDLYRTLVENHLVLSEYPLQVEPKKQAFPERNRLLAALGEAILVVEAKERSGTAHTVQAALELGKEVFCVPSPVGTHSSTNRLIREGATLVESANDIINDLKKR